MSQTKSNQGRLDLLHFWAVGAKRELLEESGLVSDDWELIYTWQPATKLDWALFTFVARGCQQQNHQNPDAGEKITLRFLAWDEFLQVEIATEFLRAKLDPSLMDEYRRKILGGTQTSSKI